MKKLFLIGTLIFNFLSLHAQTGYEIMKKTQDVSSGKTVTYSATMTLIDKKGQKRIREVKELSKEYNDSTKTIIVFSSPKDVSGVAYLMYDYKEDSKGEKKDSDNWLYLPAMKKVRRISGSDSSGDFMGTDFTYEDMGERGLNKDNFTLLGEGIIENIQCYKIEAISKNQNEKNPKRVLWIGKENYMLYKADFYDRQNNLQRELICNKIEKIDGYWTTCLMTMKNIISNHITTIELKNISYDNELEDSLFTVASIEKGRIK